MKKLIYIIATILIVIFTLWAVLTIYKRYSTDVSSISEMAEKSPAIPFDPGGMNIAKDRITIKSNEKEVVVNDPSSMALYTVSNNSPIEDNDEFKITYLGDYQSFIITIKSSNVVQARQNAEQAFLKKLGISVSDACFLNIVLGIAPEANMNLAGINYGLSFCPNGKPFPN